MTQTSTWRDQARATMTRWAVFLSGVNRALAAEFARQSPRAFVWWVVALAAGILLYFAWYEEPLPGTGAIIGVPAFVLLVWARRQHMSPEVGLAAVALIAVGLGHTAAEIRTSMVHAPILLRPLPAIEISGRVVSAEVRPASLRVVIDRVAWPGVNAVPPERIRLTIAAKHGLPHVGEYIAVRAALRPPMRPVLPDAFAFQRFLYFERIGALGMVFGPWNAIESPDPEDFRHDFKTRVEGTRRLIAGRIAQAIPDRDEATIAAALVMGAQGAIPEDLQEAYRISGLAHLLSISGVHMSILAAVVFFISRRGLALIPALALRLDTKKLAAVIALVVTTVYVLISGASVPAVRSYLMIGVVLVAVLADRTAISLRTVAWAALVLLALYPDAILGASFQMSFMAVVALVAIAEHANVRARWRSPEGEIMWLRAVAVLAIGLVITDIAAGGATAIFAIYHFNRFSTYSMLSNLLAAPVTSLWIMPAALVATVSIPFGLEQIPFKVMAAGIGVVNDVARLAAGWPGAQVRVPPMSTAALCVAAFGLLVLCVWSGRLRWIGAVLIVAGLMQPWLATPPDVILDEDARVLAVTDQDGKLVLRPGRGDRFIRDAWRDRYGESETAWPANGQLANDLRCDNDGCIFTRNGRRVLLAFHDNALAEDCASADMTISLIAARAFCKERYVIDRLDVRYRGSVAVWLGERRISRRYAGTTDMRPWSLGASRILGSAGHRRTMSETSADEDASATSNDAATPPDGPEP